MGWNSWDSFGTTVTEADIRANAQWMHDHLQPFGWQYITVDMEWYTTNPTAEGNGRQQQHTLDTYGRFTPALNRFPSAANGAGFAPLAAYVHSLGLRFGIHILQGVPREAMRDNTPIQGSTLHARDAGDPDHTCAWNPDYVDARSNPAAQAYYDSIARLYAGWGVDLVKVDCIAAPRFKADELVMLRKALDKTGRAIALSTSPGEPSIEHAEDLQANAQQWRISNDIWDLWHSNAAYPQGLGDQFARVAYWNRTRLPGHWPDADMLPLGELRPAPGWGKPRTSRLTPDEQRTMLTLWSIARSPLMFGGNLPLTSPETLAMLTNPEVIAVDQDSTGNTPALQRPDTAVWTARPANTSADSNYGAAGTPTGAADPGTQAGATGAAANPGTEAGGMASAGSTGPASSTSTGATNPGTEARYVAIFNLRDEPRTLTFSLEDIGLPTGTWHARDLWQRTDLPDVQTLHVTLPAHGSTLLRLTR